MAQKVLYVINSLRKAGPVIVLQNLIRNLDRRRYEPVIVKLSTDEQGRSITHQFVEDGVKIYELNHPLSYLEFNTRKVAGEIKRIIKEENPSIIHGHGYHPTLVLSLIKTDIPRIETLHNICGEDFVMHKGRFLGKYMVWRYTRALSRMTLGVAISGSVKKYYQNIIRKSDVELVYNGIKLPEKVGNKEELRKQLNLPEDSFIFIMIGSISQGKDPLTIIQAFKSRFKPDDNVRLLFLGKGGLMDVAKKEAGEGNGIEFLGWRQDVYQYLQAADYCISASRSEGFGMTFLESLAVGTPFISTRIGSFNEFCEKFPKLKEFQFNPGDVKALGDLMEKARSKKIDVSDYCGMVKEEFGSRHMADEYMKLYDRFSKGDKKG